MAASHLIEAHGRRQIVYVRGRKGSHEAEQRFWGYRHAQRDHGIRHDGTRVVQGDFTKESAIVALNNLPLDFAFDAIMTANDEMALGALEFAQARGLRVPDDLAIIGFDNVPEASRASTPLASIAQPFSEMARAALASIAAEAAGRDYDMVNSVSVKYIPRRSCGCRWSQPLVAAP